MVERLHNEVLVYDLERDEAHHLNPTAATVFELADGHTTPEQLAAQAAERVGHPVSLATVRDALQQLAAKGLLESASEIDASVSRREVVRKAALVGAGAAVAGPVIKSIVAPTPALAQSETCTPIGQRCALNNPGACCSGACATSFLGQGDLCCNPAGQPCDLAHPEGCCSGICFSVGGCG